MSEITYLCGPPGCGKTREILARYLAAAGQHGSDGVILLLPDAATVRAVQDDLAHQSRGLYDARIMTFPQLAHALLRSNRDPLMGLEPCQRALLARHVAALPAVALSPALTRHRGFIGGLCGFIDELKREAVAPEVFSETIRRMFSRDERAQGLARFYEAYQQELTRRNLYDDPGLFWQATHLLREGQDQPFDQARLILVDGFTDFTTTQLQVLQVLTQERAAVVTLTLPEDEERRGEFAAAWRLLERLQQHLGAGDVTWLAHCDDRPEPLRHVLDHLFRLRPPVLPDPEETLSVLAAPGVLAETREILREVKTLLLDGAAPDDICLIFRSLDAYRWPLQEVAREAGLPLAVLGAEPLASRPSVQAILDLLQIPLDDYMQHDVVKFLKSNFVDLAALKGDNPATPEEFEVVACEARVIGGRKQWTEQFRLYQARLQMERDSAARGEAMGEDGEVRDPQRIETERGRLERAANLFDSLASRLDELNRTQPRAEHVRRLLELIDQLGLSRRLVAEVAIHQTSDNLAAFRALLEALRQVADADRLLEQAEAIPFADFCREVILLCSDTSFDLPAAREGRVLALDAYGARQLRKPYVFIGGLVEGQWPAARHERAFFDDRERGRLNQAGLQLDLSSDAQHDETYLFYLSCAVADKRLYLTYPTMDSGGDALLRSHYVDEVERMFGEDTLTPRERRLSDSVPPPDEVVSLRELLEHVAQTAAAELLDEARLELSPEDQRLADHALAMAAIEQQRYSWDPFEAHDGVLQDPAIHARLGDAFGPEHKWSASALGQYGGCPYRFFAERVLRLETLEAPQEEVEVTDLGRLTHRVLQRFFADHQTQHPDQPLAAQALAQAVERMRQFVEQVFAEWQNQGLVTHRKLWELAQQRLQDDLAALVAYEHVELAKTGLVPRAFEADYDIHVAPEGATEGLHIHGKIDRVDVQPLAVPGEPQPYAVYDYKSGAGPSPKGIDQGLTFQMPFYVLGAAEAVLGGQSPPPQCVRWAYYSVRRPAKLVSQVTTKETYHFRAIEEYVQSALSWAAKHVAHIRGGHFPVASAACTYCDHDTMCRHAPWRAKAKSGGDGDEA